MDVNHYIPFELQIETMKRLPIKSLIRFRSVSKPWKSIIESSEFIADYNIHTHLYNHQQLLVSLSDSSYAYTFDDNDDDNFPEHQHNFRLIPTPSIHQQYNHMMIGYSQGLFAVYRRDEYFRKFIAIWNPSIRKSVDIPLPNRLKWPQYNSVIGFGVCNAIDPMILKIAIPIPKSGIDIWLQVELFKLSTRKWRRLSNRCRLPRESLRFCQKVVSTERFIYWLVYDRIDKLNLSNLIMSFDMINEKFTEIPLPPSLAYEHHNGQLELVKLSRESLAVLETDTNNVWMMMMEHDGQYLFKKLFTIKNPDASITVFGFRKNGQPMIYKQSPSEDSLCVYERDSKLFKRIGINFDRRLPFFVGSYMGTLLLLDH